MLLPQCPSQESIAVICILSFSTGLIGLDIGTKTFHYIWKNLLLYFTLFVFTFIFLNVFIYMRIYLYKYIHILCTSIMQIKSPIVKIQISSQLSQFSFQHILQLNIQNSNYTSRFSVFILQQLSNKLPFESCIFYN